MAPSSALPVSGAASATGSRPPEANTPVANTVFRRLRGDLSPGEFAAAVRRAAREIGERVSCDARYIGRVESGEIRCPNYAYERVFKHMFPGYSLTELGFQPREAVRGGRRSSARGRDHNDSDEESGVLRRAFMTSGPTAVLAAALPPVPDGHTVRRVGGTEVRAVEEVVRRIRLLDDRHGADGLYQRAGHSLRAAHTLLDRGACGGPLADRLYAGAGELAVSVGWLAHDSGRHADARSHYSEALATARMAGDPALEAHAFCNTAFLARDDGRPREAVQAAQAAQRTAGHLGSARLMSLLALREAGGWAGLGDRTACERALARAARLYASGPRDADPEWMTFFGDAEYEGLRAQCWSQLGDHRRAAAHARRGVALQNPHFSRNIALYSAQLACDLAACGEPEEAATAGRQALGLLGGRVRSSRIQAMLGTAARTLRPYGRRGVVAEFLADHGGGRSA